jgi:hypothetical protein
MRILPFFIRKNRRKFPVITENFGCLWENFSSRGSKFPDYMEQSFSPPQTDESGAIHLGGGNLRKVL